MATTGCLADDLGARLRARFGDDVEVADAFGHAVADGPGRARTATSSGSCRDEPEFGCDFCDFTAGVDLRRRRRLRGRHPRSSHSSTTTTSASRCACPPTTRPCRPISDLFPTCDWHERETSEMFGIRFDGHPHPVKLLLPEPFEGYPLRKDFPLMSREVKPWPGAVEGEEDEDE